MNFITLGNRQRDTILVALLTLKIATTDADEFKHVLDAVGVKDPAQLLDDSGIDQLVEAISPGGVQCHNEEFPGLLDGYTNTLISLRQAVAHLSQIEPHMDGIEAYLNSMDGGLMNTGEVEVEDDGLKVTVDVPEAEATA